MNLIETDAGAVDQSAGVRLRHPRASIKPYLPLKQEMGLELPPEGDG